MESYSGLGLVFEPNVGQTDPEVRFLARGRGYSLFLTDREAVLVLSNSARAGSRWPAGGLPRGQIESPRAAAVCMRLVGTGGAETLTGAAPTGGVSNCFLGKDPRKWRTRIPHYARVEYRGVYPGVDLVFHSHEGWLEYDFVLAPGADARVIGMAWEGVQSLRVGPAGDLVMDTAVGELHQRCPRVYQELDGRRVEVAARYSLRGGPEVGFELASYDPTHPVVIDPVLVYSTFLGGSQAETGSMSTTPLGVGLAVAVDSKGNAYVTGDTTSADFPTPVRAYRTSHSGMSDVFVAKLNAAGTALLYSTFLGGAAADLASGIAVDAEGNAYIVGTTKSADFPTIPAYGSSYNGGADVFVSKLGAAGDVLAYSTFLGGTRDDYGSAIAVDVAGSAYLAGYTTSQQFPVTAGAFDTSYGVLYDAFVTKLNPTGTALLYSTFLGGSDREQPLQSLNRGFGIAVDSGGCAVVVVETTSPKYPTTSGAFDTSHNGLSDIAVSKLNATGAALVFSTFLGGIGEDANPRIALDGSGNAYVTGHTYSPDFPVTPGAYDASLDSYDAFVTKLDAAGTRLHYSTLLGGKSFDFGYGIAVDGAGSAYITGRTGSADFPTTVGAFQRTNRLWDAFLAKVNPTGTALAYSTFLGGSRQDDGWGIALDAAGNIYVVGRTASADFPATSLDTSFNGGDNDAFVAKFSARELVTVKSVPSALRFTVAGADCSPGTYLTPHTVDVTMGATCSLQFPSPQSGSGSRYSFDRWEDGAADNPRRVVVQKAETTLAASFRVEHMLARVVSPPVGGSLVASPSSLDGFYAAGASVQLSAAPAPGYAFVSFSGDLTGSINPQSISMSAPRAVTANFACVYALASPGAVSVPTAGVSGQSLGVTTGEGCAWTATSGAGWISITSGASGTGTGSIRITVGANTSQNPRSGTLSILGGTGPPLTVTVTQAGTGPWIVPDGVVNGASFQPGFAPGTWLTIRGYNLAPATRVWGPEDFAGNRLPTQLDGISVAMNGQPGYVYYVSPTQINLLSPDSPSQGAVAVEVITPLGRSSAVTVQAQGLGPAFFMFDPEGRKYVAAVHADGVYLGKPNLFAGLETRPAKPGESVLLFGTGFGETDPPVPPGELVGQPARLSRPVAIRVGGVPAAVAFAGLVSSGLYQFNITVPEVPDGDHAVVAEIAGFRTQPQAYITFQR